MTRPHWIQQRQRSERGAVAVLFAALVVVIFAFAALGVDLATQINRKHVLINQLDAASTAAAARLGGDRGTIAGAVDAATTYFAANGEDALDVHEIDFWCVAARKLNPDNTPFSPARVADYQIPTSTQSAGVCNPDAVSSATTWRLSEYQDRPRAWDRKTYSMTCSATLCAVPCALNAQPANGWDPGRSAVNNRPIRCNTVRVGAEEDVPFSFAPALGIDEGSTGSQISVACTGSCGTVAPNPMDVVVVADRTLSMTEPLGCTASTDRSCRDYRSDLVAGITSMLQVMTPEQQFVALGALGPSARSRSGGSSAESRACTSNSTSGQGLVYPGPNVSAATVGSWIPITFKKDYLGSPDANGRRSVNTNSKLVQAVNCLDDMDTTSKERLTTTRTALASPLKAAARYLLGRTSDGNNIAALGGGNRSGSIKKVIIFETDGEPWENETTTGPGALTLDNESDIFAKYTDYSTSTSTSAEPSLGSVQDGSPSNLSATPPSSYTQNGRSYTYTYKQRTSTTTTTTTRATTGGQSACQNFLRVAEMAKQAGILVITIGYNLDGSTMCSGSNDKSGGGSTTTSGTPWISGLTPTACRAGGAGTQADPYTKRTACAQNMTVTYTVPQTRTATSVVTAPGDASVTSVLADASGGPDAPAAVSNGCTSPTDIASENADDDLFFCAARGDDMAPLFITALSKVSTGVKLITLP